MRNAEYEIALHEIIKAIHQINATTQENNQYLIKAFTEQKEINEQLVERIKALEDHAAEQILLGDKK